jgi:hypothetical protein
VVRASRALLVGSPGFLLALLGLAHPIYLTPATADRWRLVHVLLLPVFPLVAGALILALRGARGLLPWAARIAGLVFAVLYGALDAIAGIGAAAQVQRRGRAAPIGDLFAAGDQLGHLGVLALAGAFALAGLVLWRESGRGVALAGGALGALSCRWLFLHHIFAPRGVLAATGIGVGLVLLSAGQTRWRATVP